MAKFSTRAWAAWMPSRFAARCYGTSPTTSTSGSRNIFGRHKPNSRHAGSSSESLLLSGRRRQLFHRHIREHHDIRRVRVVRADSEPHEYRISQLSLRVPQFLQFGAVLGTHTVIALPCRTSFSLNFAGPSKGKSSALVISPLVF